MYYINLDVESDERYDLRKFMEFDDIDLGFDILTPYFFYKLEKILPNGKYRVVNEQYNPSLVSYNIYGSTDYWWIIMIYNNIFSFDDIILGLELQYPSIEDLEDLYFELKSKSLGRDT